MTDIQAWVQPALPRVMARMVSAETLPHLREYFHVRNGQHFPERHGCRYPAVAAVHAKHDGWVMQMETTADADHDYVRTIVQHYKHTMAKVENQYGKNVELIYAHIYG